MTLAAKLNFKWNKCAKTDLRKLIPNANSDGIALIEWMLNWDPKKRPTASQVFHKIYIFLFIINQVSNILFHSQKVLKHPFFKGLQEIPVNTNIENPVQTIENHHDNITADLNKLNEPIKSNLTLNTNNNKSSTTKVVINSNANIINNNNSNINKNKSNFKDSISDIDDMLLDFEKKYQQSSSTTNKQQTVINEQKISKTPTNYKLNNNNNNNNQIRDSIFAQFKEDPIFSELLQSTTVKPTNNNNNNNNYNQNNRNINALSGKNKNNQINNNIGLQRKNSILDNNFNSNTKTTETTMQKKKFDDLFNTFSNNENTKIHNNNKKLLDDLLFDDENLKPSVKKINLPSGANNNNNNNNLFKEMTSENLNNRNAGVNRINQTIKSGRNDILEEIFGDDLFSSLNKDAFAPATSKNKPQLSKKTSTNSNLTANKYDDLFSNANNNTNNKDTTKDIFAEFGFDYEPTFLKDDSNKPDNQFQTRRSRYLPSGKRESLFNQNSATNQNQNSAKTGNTGGIGVGGGAGGWKLNSGTLGSGKQNSYVPSFAAANSGKGDKSKIFSIKYSNSALNINL